MFPGPGAVVYRNEEGEPLGWDYPSEPEPMDPYEDRRSGHQMDLDDAYSEGKYDAQQRRPRNDEWAEGAYGRAAPHFVTEAQAAYDQGWEEGQ